jgi:carbon monoxide dehydrogenase subunit G
MEGGVARYLFVTTWQLETTIESVWQTINEPEKWPEWWPAVKSVTNLAQGDDQGIGRKWCFVYVSKLPYKLAFESEIVHKEPPFILEGKAHGELAGSGRWELRQEGSVATVRYIWDVATTKGWMNLLAPLLRPLFSWNHNITMQACGKGMARYLGARLVRSASDDS